MRVLLLVPLLAACHVFESPTVDCVAGARCAQNGKDSGTTTDQPQNHAPSSPEVSISPADPADTDTLTVVIDKEAVDPDGDTVKYRFEWSQNGTVISGSKETVAGSKTEPGDVFEVKVYATDGHLESEPASASVTVASLPNQPPVINSVVISPAKPAEKDPLEVTIDATDPDGDALTYSYIWYRDGVEATDVGNRPGVDARYHVPGDHWTVQVTASDKKDTVSATSDPVEIWGTSSFVKLSHKVTGTTDPNRTSFTGKWYFNWYSEGNAYGHISCNVVYDLTSVRSKNCASCTYDFTLKINENSAESTLGPGCESLAANGTGEAIATYNTDFQFSNNDIFFTLYYTNVANGYYDVPSSYQIYPNRYASSPIFSYDSYRNLNVTLDSYYYFQMGF